MSPNGMQSAALAGRCKGLDADRFQPGVADYPIGSIAPGPASAEIENTDFVAYIQHGNRIRPVVGINQEWRGSDHVTQ